MAATVLRAGPMELQLQKQTTFPPLATRREATLRQGVQIYILVLDVPASNTSSPELVMCGMRQGAEVC